MDKKKKAELKTVFVKPSPGCMVRKGVGQPFLSDEGESVPLDIYWKRRIRMEDVVVVLVAETKPLKKGKDK